MDKMLLTAPKTCCQFSYLPRWLVCVVNLTVSKLQVVSVEFITIYLELWEFDFRGNRVWTLKYDIFKMRITEALSSHLGYLVNCLLNYTTIMLSHFISSPITTNFLGKLL